jgi:hypothetical protein
MVQSKDAKQGLSAGAGSVRCCEVKQISKVKVLGSCDVRVLSKQARVRCLVPVRVYPSKDKMAWFGAVLSAMGRAG